MFNQITISNIAVILCIFVYCVAIGYVVTAYIKSEKK